MELSGLPQRRISEERAILHHLLAVSVNLRSHSVEKLPSMALEDIEFIVADYMTAPYSMVRNNNKLAIALKRITTEFLEAQNAGLAPN